MGNKTGIKGRLRMESTFFILLKYKMIITDIAKMNKDIHKYRHK